MCMWNESFAGRGGNEVAYGILKVMNTGITNKKNLIVDGHSFLPCDSDFSFIVKRKAVTKTFILKVVKPFKIVSMRGSNFFHIQSVADQIIYTKHLNKLSASPMIHQT
ncbi:hypothetical protein PR048_016542 [Dryococelus australis]|uniref:Uncharacterized protein n=1 Tax=Dryococelus australis TaxID=614101 RepID=A0ABQ9HK23_9NEOP|nr:hypothetical protein PR048_016542 [Dryococelus australis]